MEVSFGIIIWVKCAPRYQLLFCKNSLHFLSLTCSNLPIAGRFSTVRKSLRKWLHKIVAQGESRHFWFKKLQLLWQIINLELLEDFPLPFPPSEERKQIKRKESLQLERESCFWLGFFFHLLAASLPSINTGKLQQEKGGRQPSQQQNNAMSPFLKQGPFIPPLCFLEQQNKLWASVSTSDPLTLPCSWDRCGKETLGILRNKVWPSHTHTTPAKATKAHEHS